MISSYHCRCQIRRCWFVTYYVFCLFEGLVLLLKRNFSNKRTWEEKKCTLFLWYFKIFPTYTVGCQFKKKQNTNYTIYYEGNRTTAAPLRYTQASRGQSQVDVQQNRRAPTHYQCQHTHIYKYKHTLYKNTQSPYCIKDCYLEERKKGRRCVLSVHLLCSSVWRDLCLAPFHLHPAENHNEAQVYCSFSRRETDRHTLNISRLQRLLTYEELGTTWNTVWWLNQAVRNHQDKRNWKHFVSSFSWKSFIWGNSRLFWTTEKGKCQSVSCLWVCAGKHLWQCVCLHTPQYVEDAVCLCFI